MTSDPQSTPRFIFTTAQGMVVRRLIIEVRRSRELLGMALPLDPRPSTDDEMAEVERLVSDERRE
jgi:hypothetical protein